MKNKKPVGIEEVSAGRWVFEFAHEKWVSDEQLDEGVEIMDSDPKKAELLFRKVLEVFPWDFDAFHHLAIIRERGGKFDEAYALWEKSANIGKSAFQKNLIVARIGLNGASLKTAHFCAPTPGLQRVNTEGMM